ncbi:TonB-dependent receptor [Owenweeksia hongkongensis]|uniref:TonB-dependent receptor n=1 Tax=Owenweeksia hongkongensis TaxID=253245 RepID=UPI003A905D2A
MTRFYYSVLFLLCFSIVAYGQQCNIGGQVLLSDGTPLIGAHLILEETKKAGVTDANGVFSISNIPHGTHTLVVSSMEAKTLRQKIKLHKDKHTINLTAEPSNVELEEAQVAGKTVASEIESSGFAVNALETKDIQYQSIQVNDMLDQSTGVRIRQTGGLGSQVVYNINGLSGNSVRIFIDGIPIENYGSSFSLSSIPSSSIERVEVYKGVVPAHLGGDALGGAINVITKKQAENSLNVSYSFGSFNTHQASVNGNYRNQKNGLTFRGSAFYNYSDNNYDVWGDKVYTTGADGKKEYITAERFHDSYQSRGGKAELGFTNVKWADQAFVGVLLSDLDKDIQHGATMELVYGNRRAEQSTQAINLLYTKNDFLLKGLDINISGLYSNLRRNIIDTVPYMYDWSGNRVSDYWDLYDGEWLEYQTGAEAGNPTLNEDREKKLTGRANLTYRINTKNKVVLNYLATDFQRKPDDPLLPDAERELIDTRHFRKSVTGVSYENTAFDGRLTTSIFGKFYYQYVKLKDAVRGRDAVTAYEYEDSRNETGYGIAAAYYLFPKVELTASAENAIRMPGSTEIFGNTAENVDASYELEPERSTNFNVGFVLGMFGKKKHNVGFNANFFYRNIQGMIMPGVPDQQDETFSYVNVHSVLSTGFDAEVKYSFDQKLNYRLGVSLANPRFNTQYDEYGDEYLYYKDRLRNEPFFTVNSNLRYTMRDVLQKKSRLNMYYNLGYVHEFYRNWPSIGGANKDVIPSQMVHDVGVAYTFPKDKLTLSADARNLLNEQVFDNWALQKPGRAFYVKASYSIF